MMVNTNVIVVVALIAHLPLLEVLFFYKGLFDLPLCDMKTQRRILASSVVCMCLPVAVLGTHTN